MIRRITVLETCQPTLDYLLPSGQEVRTDSGLVYLVGQNRSGKTAFLRLLQSSLLNKRFYDMYNTSILPQLLVNNENGSWVNDEDYKSAKIPKADRNKYAKIDEEGVHNLKSYQRLFPQLGLTESDFIHLPPSKRKRDAIIPTKSRYYEFIHAVAELTSPNEREPFGQLENQAWKDSMGNQTGLPSYTESTNALIKILKKRLGSRFPDIPDFVYERVSDGFRGGRTIQKYEIQCGKPKDGPDTREDKMGQGPKLISKHRLDELYERIAQITKEKVDRTTWGWFRPDDYDTPLFGYEASPHISVRNQIPLSDIKGSVEIPIGHLVYNPQFKASRQPSSGQRVMEEFECHFKTIDRFFTKGELPMEQYLLNRMVPHGERRIQEALRNVPKFLKIPPDAHLAFFVDEPEVYLDVSNQGEIRKTLFELVDKYKPRLQLFMATNSTDLIRAAPTDALFIQCSFGKPVTVGRQYTP